MLRKRKRAIVSFLLGRTFVHIDECSISLGL
jgi:hypothetical protein